MKKRSQTGFLHMIPSIIIGFLAVGSGIVAVSQNASPGGTLYGVKSATQKARLALSFTQSEKAKTHLSITLQKLAELEKLQNTADAIQLISDTAKSLQEHQDAAIDAFDKSIEKSKNPAEDLVNKLQKNSELQNAILKDLLNKIPDSAQEIQKATDSSSKGLQKAQNAKELNEKPKAN